MIRRTCPKCKVDGLHYYGEIPPAYGPKASNSVLVLCGAASGCEHQWRTRLRREEKVERMMDAQS